MNGEITLTLPVPPSVNRYWRVMHGRPVLSDVARAYKQEIYYTVRCPMLTGQVIINLTVFRSRKRGDIDNYLKCMLDSLQGVLYANDDQIVEIHIFREDDAKNPRVELTAWERE